MNYITVMVGDVPDYMLTGSTHAKLYFRPRREDGVQVAIPDPKSLNPNITRQTSSIVKELFLLKKDSNLIDCFPKISRSMSD